MNEPVGVELNSKEVVGCVAIVVSIGETHVLGLQCIREVVSCSNEERNAMTTDGRLDAVDGKDVCDRKRLHCPIGLLAEVEWSWVERMAFEPEGAIGQLK